MYVYKLMDGDEVVYVGKTANPQQRVTQHRVDKKFDRVFVSQCIEADRVEKELIGHYKPKYNCDFRNYDGSFVCLDWELFYIEDSVVNYRYPKRLMSDTSLTPAEKSLWVVLYHRNKECKAAKEMHSDTLKLLGSEAALSKTKVQEALKVLIGNGYISARKVATNKGATTKWVFDDVVDPNLIGG